MPLDLKIMILEIEIDVTQISRVLYKGDAKIKESKKNDLVMNL